MLGKGKVAWVDKQRNGQPTTADLSESDFLHLKVVSREYRNMYHAVGLESNTLHNTPYGSTAQSIKIRE